MSIPKYAFLKLIDGILGQSSSPHKKLKYLKITVTLNFKISTYGRWSSFRASTSFRVFAAYLTISQPI